jgi:tubulin beta
MSGVTASMRFPGQLNSDLRKLATNLVAFPRVKFLSSSIAPLTSRASTSYRKLTVKDMIDQAFDHSSMVLTHALTIHFQRSYPDHMCF